MTYRWFLVATALLIATPAAAQTVDEQLWLQANAATKLGDSVTLTLESIARFGDRAGGFYHDEFGGVVSFKASKIVEISAGYRHVDDYDHGVAKPNEERLREQVGVTLGGGFTARLRLEQRFRRATSAIGVRIRPQIRYSQPLGGKQLSLFVAHEDTINLNTTSWGQRGGFDRMRNSIGLSFPLVPKVKAECSYINQYRFGRGGARDQMDHIASLSLTLSL